MIHFEHIGRLWLLLLPAAAGMLWIASSIHRRRRLEVWADSAMFGRLIPDQSGWRPTAKALLSIAGMSLLVIALANPQSGTRIEKGKRSGSDIALCLDVSNSMRAEDVQPNRLERSKRVVNNLLGELGADRVSLVVFAGNSFIQMPLTNDYSATKLFLGDIDCDIIPQQGTAIGEAIGKAMESFGYGDENRTWEKNKARAIIVISDGENFEDDAIEAARTAAKEGIRVCTIGMGFPEGTPIPEHDSRGKRGGYKHDANGDLVMTKLNEPMLREIAAAGNGVYVRAGNVNSGLSDITKLIADLEKTDFEEAEFSAFESRFMYPLAGALLCLLAEVLINERRNRKWNIDNII